jgi:hypothetical protein
MGLCRWTQLDIFQRLQLERWKISSKAPWWTALVDGLLSSFQLLVPKSTPAALLSILLMLSLRNERWTKQREMRQDTGPRHCAYYKQTFSGPGFYLALYVLPRHSASELSSPGLIFTFPLFLDRDLLSSQSALIILTRPHSLQMWGSLVSAFGITGVTSLHHDTGL